MRSTWIAAVSATALAVAVGATAVALAGTSKVGVTEKDFGLKPTVTSVKAGTVTFSVKDAGHLNHEFIVLKTSTAANKLKIKGQVAVLTGVVGKLPQFKPGQTKTLTLKLTPGHYILLCNLPAHYKAGQYASFTVK